MLLVVDVLEQWCLGGLVYLKIKGIWFLIFLTIRKEVYVTMLEGLDRDFTNLTIRDTNMIARDEQA
jgi:hypothetical protein